jgi:uncharacterized membrane protein YhaH (DUF805 family)
MIQNGADEPGIVDCGVAALKRYGEFSGRARRKEYWGFQLVVFVPILAIMYVGAAINSTLIAIISVLACAYRKYRTE